MNHGQYPETDQQLFKYLQKIFDKMRDPVLSPGHHKRLQDEAMKIIATFRRDAEIDGELSVIKGELLSVKKELEKTAQYAIYKHTPRKNSLGVSSPSYYQGSETARDIFSDVSIITAKDCTNMQNAIDSLLVLVKAGREAGFKVDI